MLSRVSIHAKRDIVLPVSSVRLSVTFYISKQTHTSSDFFHHGYRGITLLFRLTAVTNFKRNPSAGGGLK